VVYVVDDRDRFVMINRQFAQLFDMDPEAVVGRSLYDFFPPDVADQFAANNRKALQTEGSCEFEEVVQHPDGPHTYVSVKAPLYDAEGVPYAICGISTDISERKRLMSALEAAQRQKDAFIATIAHELRQPLGAIQAALALMRARVSRDKGERARTILERQVAQLSRLVEDLLDASRIAQGSVTLRREHTTLNSIIDAAINVVQPLIAGREQHLSVELPCESVWLEADAQRLQQVFSNLLTNASKFTDPHGDIAITVEPRADAVIVRVRDTGRGIAADVLPHIFDLFAQATPDERGLGIGLAVVRGLVEGHGGTVDARSGGPGQGSEFTVRLPVAPAAV
jgi:PAS domain S-box-containing protein